MDKYKFGEFIYSQRKKLGLTQDELGRMLNVTNKAVSKWETGETLPEVSSLEALSSALNVTIDELLTQKKADTKEVVIEKKNYFFVIASVILLITSLVLSIILANSLSEKETKENITLANFNKYYLVTPCNSFDVNGSTLTINGSISKLYEIENPKLILSFNIHYFYENLMGGESELLYYDREISYSDENNDFILTLTPKSEINNFKQFTSFTIDYEVKEVSGYITILK